jgi:hypothetical protein
MNTNTRTLLNLALVAIVILLALVLFYEPDTEPKPVPPPLTSVDPDHIQVIRVAHKAHEEIQLERKEGSWLLTAPIQAPANESMVEVLLGITKTASHSRYSVQDLNLTSLGLEPPEARLYLDDLAIAFGTTEPMSQRRYVLLGDTVHLISDTVFRTIASNTPDFVDPTLLPGDHPITELRLPRVTGSAGDPEISPKHTITLRQDQGHWIADGISGKKPTSEAIAKLVRTWQQSTAQRVELKGDKAALVTLEIQREGVPPIHFELLATLPRLVLARPDFGVQYHLPATAWKTLFQLPQD